MVRKALMTMGSQAGLTLSFGTIWLTTILRLAIYSLRQTRMRVVSFLSACYMNVVCDLCLPVQPSTDAFLIFFCAECGRLTTKRPSSSIVQLGESCVTPSSTIDRYSLAGPLLSCYCFSWVSCSAASARFTRLSYSQSLCVLDRCRAN